MNVERTVQYFHDKLGIAPQSPVKPLRPNSSAQGFASELSRMAESCLGLYKSSHDQSWLRLHLILEETSELVDGLIAGDKVNVLDALADLLYVTAGTAAVYNLPLTDAFLEVHRSNMTKERQQTDVDGDRVRDKGPNYDPPNLRLLLAEKGLL